VEPLFPLIDAHIHLWDFSTPPYFACDLIDDTNSGHDVHASVYVECTMGYDDMAPTILRPVGETRFALSQAVAASSEKHQVSAAILGAADLSLGKAVEPLLQAHKEAGQGRFRGIRTRAAWDADPWAGYLGANSAPEGLLRQPEFVDGVNCLGDNGLSLDVWLFHTQLPEVCQLAQKCPNVHIVLNHTGGPLGVGVYDGKREEVFAIWAANIREVAKYPNVHIKLGGLGISRIGFGLDLLPKPLSSDALATLWSPYIATCIDAFGPERCMFASNFPVDKVVCSYTTLWNSFKKLTSAYTPAERSSMLFGNAQALYRI
jgi:predicted TIM-barrel fold metal-dependent hydrolase